MNNPAKKYQENHILTAPKEQLLLMLVDGAIRFTEQGKAFMLEEKFEESCKKFIRAQRIMIELITSLDESALEPDLYSNLVSLYYFVYRRLVEVNMSKEEKTVDEALKILKHIQETWVMAVEKMHKEQHPEASLVEKAQRQINAQAAGDPPPENPSVDFST